MSGKMLKSAACAVALLVTAAQAQADVVAGPYLAARAAGAENDFGAASDFFLRALEHDPTNPGLIDNCLLALIGLGELDRAAPIAEQAVSDLVNSQLANMVLLANAAEAEDWPQLITQLDDGLSVGERVDALSRGWALIGTGDSEAGLAAFDQAAALPGSEGFGTYHKAMALGMLGRFEEARALLSDSVPRTRRSVIAHIQILTELGENEAALEVLDSTFGRNMDPGVLALRAAVESGGITPFTLIQTPGEGVAETFYTEGGAYIDNTPPAIVLLYAQIAQTLHGDEADFVMMSAGLLTELERFDQAAQTFAQIRRDDPAFHSAEFGRADVLRKAGNPDLAIEVLQAMLRGYPQLAMAHSELGDIFRTQSQMAEARDAYTTALDLVPPSDGRHWVLRYKRAIAFHQLDDWDSAETDFRAALELNPEHAGLLNYLGYSLVERGEHLPEALDMIERAIRLEPDNGAIVDSLGWAYFSLGRFEEAVAPMEKAAQLLPEDATINDHLGDVYWAVGRELEAHFQWERALSFATDEDMADAIREKLENGLNVAMTDAAQDDTTVAQDL